MTDLFTAAQSGDAAEGFADPFALLGKQLKGGKKEKKGFAMPKVPEGVVKAVMKHGNRIMAIPNGRKWVDYDIED